MPWRTRTTQALGADRNALQASLQERAAKPCNSLHRRASSRGGEEAVNSGGQKHEKPLKTAGKSQFPVVSESGEAGIQTLGTLAGTLVLGPADSQRNEGGSKGLQDGGSDGCTNGCTSQGDSLGGKPNAGAIVEAWPRLSPTIRRVVRAIVDGELKKRSER